MYHLEEAGSRGRCFRYAPNPNQEGGAGPYELPVVPPQFVCGDWKAAGLASSHSGWQAAGTTPPAAGWYDTAQSGVTTVRHWDGSAWSGLGAPDCWR